MGEAGQAAGGILLLVENPNKVRARSDKWNDDHIVGSGSKNIPLLQFAHDLLLADRTNDQPALNDAWTAMNGYLDYTKREGHFMGEAYSTIYWRWIVVPVWITAVIAHKRQQWDLVNRIDKWIQDFVVINSLAALPSTHYFGSELSSAAGKRLPGMPCAAIMGARSWVYNDGDDGKRGWDDSMSWVDATSHAPWLAWALQQTGVAGLGGGDGWVKKVCKGMVNIYGPRPVVDPAVVQVLVRAVREGVYPEDLVNALEYGPRKPMVIGRTTSGTWCLGEQSYTEGSTSFMHVKVLPADTLAYKVYGVAHPLKRSNSDPAVGYLSESMRRAELVARDGTVFDFDTKKEVQGSLQVPLLDGDFLWVVRVAAGRQPERLDAHSGPDDDQNGDGGWCDWYKRLF